MKSKKLKKKENRSAGFLNCDHKMQTTVSATPNLGTNFLYIVSAMYREKQNSRGAG